MEIVPHAHIYPCLSFRHSKCTQYHLEANQQIPRFATELWIRGEGISQMVCGLRDDMTVIQFNSLYTLWIPHARFNGYNKEPKEGK